ncbi:Eco57I restriction-modification methylase [Nonlabens sp. Hel1_33_55]|uniref:Eco57I restriction-modification methylase domain-containing protein n=1 Tax=Nonlabens sp. Hel1_33_55 TaxID=1336802 RepID=UPI000875CA69|nr:TaqI-like C-terminal specificity domain-containing protein [Nonlabens sp. Hel1_33_55]SCY00506.1 Eco57I restriction-modification methylase [Nonlabens sp. Hel1_33_55]
MALFQTSVIKSHLAQLDESIVDKAYKKFQKYFWNTTIQTNIRTANEEQYQATFLHELFVNILGYTLFPNPNSNLTTEFKNQTNARKADGAILKESNALAVIELKGMNTKDLESIRKQAFDYKNYQTGCVYIITSNFEKLRFYINDATEFEEFDLFTLSRKRFNLLYLCLHKDKLLQNAPLHIKQASIVEEEEITKAFYKDYSVFKRELYRDLVKRNSKTVKSKLTSSGSNSHAKHVEANIDTNEDLQRLEKNVKLTLFKKSQKLIDRFLFIFFAEDRSLLPSNFTNTIITDWKKLVDMHVDVTLYERFKLNFNFLDQGRAGKEGHDEIYAYNGGLFKPDSILDALDIDSELLYKHALKLSKYDFESQVDVNILGHIFENSLNEIESVNAEIEGGEFDKQTSKRKKDGVFYTPKYITKYIVDNTVGKLCEEKKRELKITDERFGNAKARSKKGISDLETYRNWLLELTICDPACGSGAFLNQALEFLIREHNYLDELSAKYHGGFAFPDIENTILENNIYGVDLNEESVEIAKLSLWLRTAQPRRKLNDLSSNIKCGNSLIDSKAVAGDKAFKWESAFAKVFSRGGFDVVIGNPPYVRQELFTDIKPYLKKHYNVFQGTADLYTYFFELSVDKLIKETGIYSIIVANKWMQANYAKPLRKWLSIKQIVEIVDFGDLNVFKDVAAYPCVITIKSGQPNNLFRVTQPESLDFADLNLLVEQTHFNVASKNLTEDSWSLVDKSISDLTNKLKALGTKLIDYVDSKIFYGVKTGYNEAFLISREEKEFILKQNSNSIELIKPFLAGRDVKRYAIDFNDTYLILIPNGWTDKHRRDLEPIAFMEKYHPEIITHLSKFKEKAKTRSDQGEYWWELRSCSYYDEFDKPKLLLPDISKRGNFALDLKEHYTLVNTAYIIGNADLYLLGILNSKLITFFTKASLQR